ncbi:hypothetical protein [Bradyrhizobium sp. USDA 3364]
MQIKETIGVSLPGSVEDGPLEDVVVLVDSAGVALGVRRAVSARVRGVCDRGNGLIASRCVEIPIVGSNGEVSGILCRTDARSDKRGSVAPRRRETVKTIADMAQLVAHDINNLLAVIDGGLWLLERQNDAAHRKAIIGRMREAIARGALLSRQLLDAARSDLNSIDGLVEGNCLAAMAASLDRASRSTPRSPLTYGPSMPTQKSCISLC